MLKAYRVDQMTLLRAPVLEAVPGVVHAFSTRRGLAADLSIDADPPGGDERTRFFSAAGMAGWPTVRLKQVHSNRVHPVPDNWSANETAEADASCTALPGLALSVATADCAPILISHAAARAVAAVHAGWRGTSEGVVRRAVETMRDAFGLDPADLRVAIGPHIAVCCLEVGEEVYDWFQDPEIFVRRPEWPRPHLDLAAANRRQLTAAGVPPGQIQVSGLCTRCRADLFHSYRREGEASGRMLAVIGLEP